MGKDLKTFLPISDAIYGYKVTKKINKKIIILHVFF